MINLQNNFDQYALKGFHGQLNKSFPSWIASRHAEGGSLGFGVVVVAGTKDDQCVLPPTDPSASYVLGVTERTQAVENDAAGKSAYRESTPVSIVQKGVMYVAVADGCTQGGKVYFKKDTGEIVSTSTDNFELVGAKFTTTVSAGEVAQLELSL